MVEPLPQSLQLTPVFTQHLHAEAKFQGSIGDFHKIATLETKLCTIKGQLATDLKDKVAANEKSETRKAMFEQVSKHLKDVEDKHKDYVFRLKRQLIGRAYHDSVSKC